MLRAQGLSVEVGGQVVVSDATFTVMPRDKVGIVGRNGAGKTSLFRVLGGDDEPIAGQVIRQGRLGYLSQDPKIRAGGETRRAIDHILSGREVDSSKARIERLRAKMDEDPSERNVERYTRALERFRMEGGYAANAEARSIAAGLGIGEDRVELDIEVLSGGERRRVELARILFAGSDILCLDEPTNHLDLDAKNWLMGFLAQYRGALIVISHDLELLDESITRVLHLDRPTETSIGRIDEYTGTYSQYLTARAEDERRRAKQAAHQAKEIARLQGVVDRFGAKATKASMAHSIERRIERIKADQVHAPTQSASIAIRFPDPPSCGRTVIEAAGLCKGYGGPPVFEDIGFDLGRGERLLILGLNGAGKTSLLRILAGQTDADIGFFEFGHQVTAGYFAQEHDLIAPDLSLLDNLRDSVPSTVTLTETELRGLLGMFGLSADKVFQDAGTLSGGEKTKLALAMLMTGRNNLLLLDEPTNNLDPASRTAVADALSGWPGSIIFVSHDIEFVDQLNPTKVLLMPDGDVDYFDDDWLDLVALS